MLESWLFASWFICNVLSGLEVSDAGLLDLVEGVGDVLILLRVVLRNDVDAGLEVTGLLDLVEGVGDLIVLERLFRLCVTLAKAGLSVSGQSKVSSLSCTRFLLQLELQTQWCILAPPILHHRLMI